MSKKQIMDNLDYQLVDMGSLGLPQRRIIPTLQPIMDKNDGLLSQTYAKLLNCNASVTSMVQPLTKLNEEDVQCCAYIEQFGTVMCSIGAYDLALLTCYYLNDLPFDGDANLNNTMRRFLERMLAENINISVGEDSVTHFNPSSLLPALVLEIKQTITVQETDIKILFYFCVDAFETLYNELIGQPELDQSLISAQLNTIPIHGVVQLLSRQMKMSEVETLQEGDVVLMDKLIPTLTFSKSLFYRGDINSDDTQLTFKLHGGNTQ